MPELSPFGLGAPKRPRAPTRLVAHHFLGIDSSSLGDAQDGTRERARNSTRQDDMDMESPLGVSCVGVCRWHQRQPSLQKRNRSRTSMETRNTASPARRSQSPRTGQKCRRGTWEDQAGPARVQSVRLFDMEASGTTTMSTWFMLMSRGEVTLGWSCSICRGWSHRNWPHHGRPPSSGWSLRCCAGH